MNKKEGFPREWHTNNFDVYDEVWIMENNKPTKKVIFAVVLSMSHNKRGQEVHYRLVNHQCGTGWGNGEGIRCDESNMFCTKEDLVDSL